MTPPFPARKPFNKRNARTRNASDKKAPGSFGGGPRIMRKRSRRTLPPLDYKDVESLSKYLTEKGKILPRRITRLSAKDQRALTRLIKKSRHAGLLSFQAI